MVCGSTKMDSTHLYSLGSSMHHQGQKTCCGYQTRPLKGLSHNKLVVP
jgi:hypothetical protein